MTCMIEHGQKNEDSLQPEDTAGEKIRGRDHRDREKDRRTCLPERRNPL